MKDDITYPFIYFNCCTVQVCEWISNFIITKDRFAATAPVKFLNNPTILSLKLAASRIKPKSYPILKQSTTAIASTVASAIKSTDNQ